MRSGLLAALFLLGALPSRAEEVVYGPDGAPTVVQHKLYTLTGRWEAVAETDAPHEAGLLRLDCRRAHERLGWRPALTLKEAAELTVTWYRAAAGGASPGALFELGVEQVGWYEKRWQAARQP